MKADPSSGSDDRKTESSNPLSKVYRLLTSLKFAVVVGLFLTVACILGTVLPQDADIPKFLQAKPSYTGVVEILFNLGFTHVFTARWFMLLLSLFALSLTACTGKRIGTIIKRKGKASGHLWGSAITHISLLIIMAGAIVRGVWGENGYLRLYEGQSAPFFALDGQKRDLPFTIKLVDFQLERYDDNDGEKPAGLLQERLILHFKDGHGHEVPLPADIGTEHVIKHPHDEQGNPSYLVRLVRTEPDFVIDMATGEASSRSNEPRNPAMLIHVLSEDQSRTNAQWLFAKYPTTHVSESEWAKALPFHLKYETNIVEPKMGPIKDFKSVLEIIEGGKVVVQKTIEVNDPLTYGGYTLFQSGYDPVNHAYTDLQVVKDPGVPLVYTGFILMIAGLTVVFYLAPMTRASARSKKESK